MIASGRRAATFASSCFSEPAVELRAFANGSSPAARISSCTRRKPASGM